MRWRPLAASSWRGCVLASWWWWWCWSKSLSCRLKQLWSLSCVSSTQVGVKSKKGNLFQCWNADTYGEYVIKPTLNIGDPKWYRWPIPESWLAELSHASMPTVATGVMFTRHIHFLFNHHHPPPLLAVVPSTTSCHRSSNNKSQWRLQLPRSQHATALWHCWQWMPAHDATGAKKGDLAQRLHEKQGAGMWLVYIVCSLTKLIHSFVLCALWSRWFPSRLASLSLLCFLDFSKGPGCRAGVWRGPTRKQTRATVTRGRPSKRRGSSTLSAHWPRPLTASPFSVGSDTAFVQDCPPSPPLSLSSLLCLFPFSTCLCPSLPLLCPLLCSPFLLPISPITPFPTSFSPFASSPFPFSISPSTFLYFPSLLPFYLVLFSWLLDYHTVSLTNLYLVCFEFISWTV